MTEIEFSLFTTLNGPVIGLDDGTLARLRVLTTMFLQLDAQLRQVPKKPSGGCFGIFTDELVLDVASDRTYKARIRVESGDVLSIPARDPETECQKPPRGHIALGIRWTDLNEPAPRTSYVLLTPEKRDLARKVLMRAAGKPD